LTVDLNQDPLREVMRSVSQTGAAHIMVEQGVTGTLDGYLESVPVMRGLDALLENNGYTFRERDGIYIVGRRVRQLSSDSSQQGRQHSSVWVQVDDAGRISLEVTGAPIRSILNEVGRQLELNLVTYAVPEGKLTASVTGLSVEETLSMLFKGTDVTFRREGTTYYIGNRRTSGIATTELIKLDHMKAEGLPELLPPMLRDQATVQVVREYNALLITGTNDVIRELTEAIDALDQPTPLILIEAIVVDFKSTDLFELGFEFGQDQQRSEAAKSEGYTFDQDGFEVEGEDVRANFYLDELSKAAGISNIGRLPEDFFFNLRALSQEGKVEIRSRPQIATLSGHSASLSIGTTQYFILRKETPIQSPNGGVTIQETERFEQVEANVSLEVTPWVTASGEVTTEIRPEFSTPVGSFQPGVPPTINSRVFESTVRLRDGETIVLGGLVQDDKTVNYNKVPILGSIPLLGQLFRSRSRNTQKSKLVVYLTPRIFYGEQAERAKWQQYLEEKELPEPEE
jgi:type IV pilus assembly protein PilQ